jgi:hypothetical protein
MNLPPRTAIFLLLPLALCGAANAQAVTEYGSMASKTVTVGKRANSISNNIGGIWGSLDKTIKGSADHSGPQSAPPARTVQRTSGTARRRSPAAVVTHEDPTHIQPGISYSELIRRFGPGSFEIATGPGTKTLSYPGKNGDINIDLLDEKVTKVTPPAPSPQVAALKPK